MSSKFIDYFQSKSVTIIIFFICSKKCNCPLPSSSKVQEVLLQKSTDWNHRSVGASSSLMLQWYSLLSSPSFLIIAPFDSQYSLCMRFSCSFSTQSASSTFQLYWALLICHSDFGHKILPVNAFSELYLSESWEHQQALFTLVSPTLNPNPCTSLCRACPLYFSSVRLLAWAVSWVCLLPIPVPELPEPYLDLPAWLWTWLDTFPATREILILHNF